MHYCVAMPHKYYIVFPYVSNIKMSDSVILLLLVGKTNSSRKKNAKCGIMKTTTKHKKRSKTACETN